MTIDAVREQIAKGRWLDTDWTALLTAASDSATVRDLVRRAIPLTGDPDASAILLAHADASEMRTATPSAAPAISGQAVPGGGDRARALTGVVRLLARSALADPGAGEPGELDVPWILAVIDPRADSTLVALAGVGLVWSERYGEAVGLLEGLEACCRRSGNQIGLAATLTVLGLLHYRLCQWTAASAAAAEALEIARNGGQPAIAAFATAVLVTVEAVQGRGDECRRRSLQLIDSPAGRTPLIRTYAFSALGLLELGEGRPDQAARWYEVLAAAPSAGRRLSSSVAMWQPDLAEAYIRLGRVAEAAEALEAFAANPAVATNRRAMAAATRCRAMLAAAEGEPEAAEALFAGALAHYEGPAWAFARARTELALAESRIGRGDTAAAGPLLERARDCFAAMGARGWASRAEDLAEANVDPADAAVAGWGLDDRELQVALAGAMGSDLDEIASGLRMTAAEASDLLRAVLGKIGAGDSAELTLHLPELVRAGLKDGPGGGAGPSGAEPVRLHLLGGFALTADGRPVQLRSGVSSRAVAQVALAGKVPAEALVEELWPGEPPGVGQARLRNLLSRLRRQCPQLLVRHGAWVGMAEGVEVDVHVFERLAGEAHAAASVRDPAAAERVQAAIASYGGELLPEARHVDSTAAPRERLRRRYMSLLEILVDDAVRRVDTGAALELLERAISADPHDSGLYVRAAKLLVAADRPVDALAVIRRAEAALAQLGLGLPGPAAQLRDSIAARPGLTGQAARKLER